MNFFLVGDPDGRLAAELQGFGHQTHVCPADANFPALAGELMRFGDPAETQVVIWDSGADSRDKAARLNTVSPLPILICSDPSNIPHGHMLGLAYPAAAADVIALTSQKHAQPQPMAAPPHQPEPPPPAPAAPPNVQNPPPQQWEQQPPYQQPDQGGWGAQPQPDPGGAPQQGWENQTVSAPPPPIETPSGPIAGGYGETPQQQWQDTGIPAEQAYPPAVAEDQGQIPQELLAADYDWGTPPAPSAGQTWEEPAGESWDTAGQQGADAGLEWGGQTTAPSEPDWNPGHAENPYPPVAVEGYDNTPQGYAPEPAEQWQTSEGPASGFEPAQQWEQPPSFEQQPVAQQPAQPTAYAEPAYEQPAQPPVYAEPAYEQPAQPQPQHFPPEQTAPAYEQPAPQYQQQPPAAAPPSPVYGQQPQQTWGPTVPQTAEMQTAQPRPEALVPPPNPPEPDFGFGGQPQPQQQPAPPGQQMQQTAQPPAPPAGYQSEPAQPAYEQPGPPVSNSPQFLQRRPPAAPQQHQPGKPLAPVVDDSMFGIATSDKGYGDSPWAGQIQDEGPRGQVVSVASAKGGAGKTTLALWLTQALHHSGKKVALVDANIGQAEISKILNVRKTAKGVQYLIEASGGNRFPDNLLAEACIEDDRVGTFLAGPLTPMGLDLDVLCKVLHLAISRLARKHEFVVVDSPVATVYENVFQSLLLHDSGRGPLTDIIALVINPHNTTAHNQAEWIRDITTPLAQGGMGYPIAQCAGILNKADPAAHLDLEDLQNAMSRLGLTIHARVPLIHNVIPNANKRHMAVPGRGVRRDHGVRLICAERGATPGVRR